MPAGTAPSSHTKSVAIISKPEKPELVRILPPLLDWFQKHDYQIVIDSETAVYASGPEVIERNEMARRALDFVVRISHGSAPAGTVRSLGRDRS